MGGKIAMCYTCKEPLVFTFFFSKKEFICLSCGRLYEFFGPMSAEPTPELEGKLESLNEEWRQDYAPYLLSGGVMLKECETCSEKYEPHLEHAAEEEKTKHAETIEKLRERTGMGVA